MPAKSSYNLFYEFTIAAAVTLGTLWCIFPSEGFFFKWWEEHTHIIMFSFLGIGLLFFFLNSKRLMVISFAACAALCLLLNHRTQVPLKNAEQTSDALVKIAQFSYANPPENHPIDSELVAMLRTQADVISLQEIPIDSIAAIMNFFTCCGYPNVHCLRDSSRNSAIALFSRFPFDVLREVNFPNAPGIAGKMEIPDPEIGSREIYFVNPYFYPSYNEAAYDKTRENLRLFAQGLNGIQVPLLVFGDYHIVSWSKDLQLFKETAGLNDSRRGIMPTSPHGYFSLFDYPFDHIFYSNHFKCISFETISSASTTHLGIVGTYQFENQQRSSDVQQTSQ
ncbi:MAG: endonuclease/exonuclease/phosphatase family protein [Saprospiraceae bacterium]|nr:endonuclease/exonuclease/phosphatase family protein [Saprospiraceae bacterium]